MKIGNIIFENDLINHKKIDYINYHKYVDDLIYNDQLSTLIVGWSLFKKMNNIHHFNDEQTILEKTVISNNLFWEFSFSENKNSNITGINSFIIDSPFHYFNKYTYSNIDPIIFNIKNVDGFIKKISSELIITYIYDDKMLYCLDFNNKIIGIDLIMLDFFGIDRIKLIDEIINRSKKYVNDSGEIYQSYYKVFPFFDEIKRYMVVFLSK